MPKGIYVRTEKHRKNLSLALTGRKLSQEALNKRKETRSKRIYFYEKGRVPWNKGLTKETDERVARSCKKAGKSRKGKSFPNWGGKDPELTKLKISNANKNVPKSPHTDAQKKAVSDKMKKIPKTKEWRKNLSLSLLGKPHDDERKKRNMEGLVNSRKQPKKMSSLEVKISEIFKFMFSPYNVYKYVGDRKFFVKLQNGKYKFPDFIDEFHHKIIEVFGRYWHRNDNSEEIIGQYKQVGWDCMVIWEDEIDVNIRDKIMLFSFPYEYEEELRRTNIC